MTALDVEQAVVEARTEADNAATNARAANGPALAAAQEAARIARIGYREGKFGPIDLLDSVGTLPEIRLAETEPLASHRKTEARRGRPTRPHDRTRGWRGKRVQH